MSLSPPRISPETRAKLSAAGRRTAEKRWGAWPHTIVRLLDLDEATRDIIVSILIARRNAIEAGGQPESGK